MNRRSHLLPSILLAGLLLLAACGPTVTLSPGATTAGLQVTATPEASIPLKGTKWTLASLHGDEPLTGTSLTLAFYEDNYMEGSAGCNSYGVDYIASDREFRVVELHRTDSECGEPPGIMPQDQAFFEALSGIAAYRATEDSLEFDNASGETILIYARKLPAAVDPALEDTEWLLISLLGKSLLEGSRITLNLGKEGFEGVAGCNNYGGEYAKADGGALNFGFFAITAMDCATPEGIMEQEQAYVNALNEAGAYRLEGNHLDVQDAARETILMFARKDEFDTDPAALPGTVWRLLSIDGVGFGEESTFTLAFYSDAVLGGHAGCRDYLATYKATGDDLTLLVEVMFDADCLVEDADLELEAQVLGVLAPKADLRLGAGQLEIYGERGGLLVFEPLPEADTLDLEGVTWSLLAFVGPNPYVEEPDPWPMPDGLLAGTTIDLTFKAGTARGLAGCNSYRAVYSRTDSSLNLGPVTHTEMACPEPAGLMEQESHYLELLAAITSYHVSADQLWLETDDRRALVFRAPLPVSGITP